MSRPSQTDVITYVVTDNLDSLFSTAMRLVNDYDTACDIVQETAQKALRGAAQLRDKQKIRAWLFKILVNSARDRMRRRGRDEEITSPEELIEDRGDVTALSRATSFDVRQALDQLGPSRRAVVVLVDLEDFTLIEAAGMLGIPAGTVASRLARARQELRVLLAAYQPKISGSGGKP